MLLLGSHLIGTAIMGLQTGTQLAQTKLPIIDPSNLKIIAYEVDGPLLTENPSFIRIADIREFGTIGMIVDSSDEFIGISDVIKIQELYEIGFTLTGMPVVDETKHKLGKVDDYSLDAESFIIQQLNVKRSILKSIADTGFLVHRSQIVEINDHHIVVKTTAEKLDPITTSERLSYINPFRATHPQAENSKS